MDLANSSVTDIVANEWKNVFGEDSTPPVFDKNRPTTDHAKTFDTTSAESSQVSPKFYYRGRSLVEETSARLRKDSINVLYNRSLKNPATPLLF